MQPVLFAQLAPKYRTLALQFADQPDVLIADMDATKNDAWHQQVCRNAHTDISEQIRARSDYMYVVSPQFAH